MAPTLIPVTGIMVPIVIVPTVLVMAHLRRRREMEHRERMRALELGHPLPASNAWPALAAIAIGAIVPGAAFVCATIASTLVRHAEAPWACASGVGLTAVIAGAILAGRLPGSRAAADVDPHANGKPAFDPDAFDVVGRRG